MRTIKIATRGSALSLCQTSVVLRKIEDCGYSTEVVIVSTRGDRDTTGSIRDIGGDGLFIREIENTLLRGEADIAVHSAKDLPCELSEGLVIGGAPDMADARDCLVARKETVQRIGRRNRNGELDVRQALAGAVIGTGSPRREAELKWLSKDVTCKDIRGNVNTRLDKLRDREFDAIILAKAGLDRLQPDADDLWLHPFSIEEMIPAPCQGILTAECREDDDELLSLLSMISVPRAKERFARERALFLSLAKDDRSCAVPIGVHTEEITDGDEERMRVSIRYRDVRAVRECLRSEYETMTEEMLAGIALSQG